MDKTRVLVADRNSFVAEGICTILKTQQAIQAIGVVMSGNEVIKIVKEQTPDIVLMDIAMTDGDGAGIIESILRESRNTKVLLMTEQEDKDRVVNGFKMGGNGCIPKNASSTEFTSAILSVQRGGYFLYPSMAKIMVSEYMRILKAPLNGPSDRLTPEEKKVLKTIAEEYQNYAIRNHIIEL